MDKFWNLLALPWAWLKMLIISASQKAMPPNAPKQEINMFKRVRELIAKGNAIADKADQRLDQSKMVLDLAQAFIEDFQDGFAMKFQLDEDAAKKFLALLTGKPGEIPVSIVVDPSWDVLPSRVAEFKGGPHDGKKYVIPNQQVELVLTGNHRYKWNGKVFLYVASKV